MQSNYHQIIRSMRIKKSLTQKDLAKKTGLSQATISRAEIDCSNMRFDHIVKIIKTIKSDQLLFGKQDNNTSIFLNIILKNKKIQSLIKYDPKKAAKLIIKLVNIKVSE